MSAHAPLAPSSAPVWGHCSGSVVAAMGAPNLDSEASREGTAAHWVGLDQCLTQWRDGSRAPFCRDWIGQAAPNGVVIDEKMAEGAQVLVDDALAICQEHGALRAMLIEHKVHMPQIHQENWGTLDLGIPLLGKGLIYLRDYKHGHRDVSPMTLQNVDYMAGLVAELKLNGYDEREITVDMGVVQPFAYNSGGPVKTWRGPLSDLRPYFNQLNHMAHEAFTDPKMTAGTHCRDCPAVGKCATARRNGYSFATHVSEPYQIDVMDARELAVERSILTAGLVGMKARLAAIDDELIHRIGNGETDSGLALEAGQGRLKWDAPPAQVVAFSQQFGVDVRKEETITPTQALQKAPKEMKPAFKEAMKAISTRPSTGLKLIDADNSLVARAFKRK